MKKHIMEFHVPYLKLLKEMGWETAVAARNDYDDPRELSIPYCDHYHDVPFERNPFHPGNLKAYRMLVKLMKDEHYDVIHCHTPVGALVGRLAARKMRKKGTVVMYTAHGFHFYKGAPKKNWLLYYPPEALLSKVTDELITINREDYERALKMKAAETVYLPGIGIDIARFAAGDRQDPQLRAELGIPDGVKVALSVGEVNQNKNHSLMIDVLPDFKDLYYVVCGSGPLIDSLNEKARIKGVADRVRFVGYRKDVDRFYRMADVFVFPSFREGLPVALMEAMACGSVAVASVNRGTNDLMGESRLRFNPKNAEDLKGRLNEALHSDCTDEIQANLKRLETFDIHNTLRIMKDIYEKAADRKEREQL
ncbi:MAG: glycosyltransferase [Lachnospiraceae bacterium]|nr:glycosyltransferase [Lachnospiraceae bacterium]